MQQPMKCGWAWVDVGKGHHWVCLIDEAGTTLHRPDALVEPEEVARAYDELESSA